jgi:thiol-disulfide isomerase/thioredoxin
VRPTPAPSLAPGATPAPTAAPTEDPAAAARAVLESKAWASTTLTDVETGQPFRIADYAGRTVFVESMAIWCSNCRAQQARFRDALAQLDPSEVAYVVLTVEAAETAEALAAYKASQGFTGTYSVAGREVSAALVAEFGPNAINPPVVPVVIVHPDGTIEFRTGAKSVDEIVATVRG